MSIKLTKKDKKILYQLDVNSRQTDSEIAKKVRLSRSAVRYRINRLFKEGVIRNCVTLINPVKFGKAIYKLYIKLQDSTKEKEQEIKSYLIQHPNVFWVTKCEGVWDIITAVWMKQPYDFYQFVDGFSAKFSDRIIEKEFSMQIEVPFFNRTYLSDIQGRQKCLWGGKISEEKVDDKDMEILKILATNSRMNVVDIAKKTKITPRIVSYRVKHLIEKKIILAFSLQLNVNTYNYDYYKTILYLKDMNKETEIAFIEFCKDIGNILYYIKNLGAWELELEWEVKDYKHLNELMNKIRLQFGKNIRRYEHLLIVEEYKGEYNTLQ